MDTAACKNETNFSPKNYNQFYKRFKTTVIVISATAILTAGAATVHYVNEKPLTTEQVAERICPCIVGVIQYRSDRVTESGEGSGIIISSDGYIVTNNHVIEGANKLEVVNSSGKRYQAKTVGRDSRTDLAVIKINATGLRTAKFGDSNACKVGEKVVAVGNPSGLKLAGSVTQGILSAIDRDIDVGNGPMNLLQTDAAINPGNSGGALVNMRGEVIGINSAKISGQGYEGIGFSIPISSARPIIESLIKYGYVKGRVKLGLNCRMIEGVTAKANNLPVGAFVESVDPKSSASMSGIKVGDIITSINNVRVTSTRALLTERDKHKPGDIVTLTVFRRRTSGTLIFNVRLMEDRGYASETEDTAGW
ncbi:trypsin-like peptidase domain-containing protein [[Clostridium] cellulosi]|jgi:PDZ domain (Also known as DHR or GLGF)./Trypsin.